MRKQYVFVFIYYALFLNLIWSHFILSGFNYYLLVFKLMIWYNVFTVYIYFYIVVIFWGFYAFKG